MLSGIQGLQAAIYFLCGTPRRNCCLERSGMKRPLPGKQPGSGRRPGPKGKGACKHEPTSQEAQRKWMHHALKALHKVVKKARGFEVRKVQRRLARAQDGTSALAAAKKIKSRPGAQGPEDTEKLTAQLAAAKVADLQVLAILAAQRAGFPPTALAAFTQRQRPNPAGSSVKATPQKHPKKASEALAGSIANLPLTEAGRASESLSSSSAAGALAAAAAPEAGAAPACSSGLPADMVALRIVKATCVKLQVEQLGKDFKERFGEASMQSAAADAKYSDDSSGTGSDGDQPHADSEESGDGATSSGSGGEQHPELTQQKHGKAAAAVQSKVGKASAAEEGKTANASAAMAAPDIEEVQDALALSALDKLLAARRGKQAAPAADSDDMDSGVLGSDAADLGMESDGEDDAGTIFAGAHHSTTQAAGTVSSDAADEDNNGDDADSFDSSAFDRPAGTAAAKAQAQTGLSGRAVAAARGKANSLQHFQSAGLSRTGEAIDDVSHEGGSPVGSGGGNGSDREGEEDAVAMRLASLFERRRQEAQPQQHEYILSAVAGHDADVEAGDDSGDAESSGGSDPWVSQEGEVSRDGDGFNSEDFDAPVGPGPGSEDKDKPGGSKVKVNGESDSAAAGSLKTGKRSANMLDAGPATKTSKVSTAKQQQQLQGKDKGKEQAASKEKRSDKEKGKTKEKYDYRADDPLRKGAQKKNRMGQHARRALAEKMYGRTAKHLQQEGEERDGGRGSRGGRGGRGLDDGDRGGQARPMGHNDHSMRDERGCNAGRTPHGSQPHAEKQYQQQQQPARKAQNHAGGGVMGSEAEGPLHPSWEAKRKLQRQPLKIDLSAPAAKKIKFDDGGGGNTSDAAKHVAGAGAAAGSKAPGQGRGQGRDAGPGGRDASVSGRGGPHSGRGRHSNDSAGGRGARRGHHERSAGRDEYGAGHAASGGARGIVAGSDESLHPSWVAKQKQRQQAALTKAAPVGKKFVFGDD